MYYSFSFCLDFDECASPDTNTCTEQQICINIVGSHLCYCKSGFNTVNYTCVGELIIHSCVCLFACLFVCLFVCLFACLLVCLFVCLLACLLVCLFVYLFACLFRC